MPPVSQAPIQIDAGLTPAQRQQINSAIIRRLLSRDPEYRRYGYRSSEASDYDPSSFVDFLFLNPGQDYKAETIFEKVRWGGLAIFAAWDPAIVEHVAQSLGPKSGFTLNTAPSSIRPGLWGLPLPIGRPIYFVTARKVHLILPGTLTDRFTYDVQLVRDSATQSWVVQKQIPDYSNVLWRLHERSPEAPMDIVSQRARKLVDKVFPVFLTREAAFLNILQRDLPKPYCDRVPKVLSMDKDKRGLVRQIRLNWLRNGGRPLSQLEFALQSTELLRALHEVAQIIHLDLRLDNFVITDQGVGFVDFGSAVRVGEDLSESQMLTTLFEEMMQTSSIQRMLGKMKKTGKVTSSVITGVHQKVDKAIDLFYLAVQFNQPHKNTDFRDLVRHDPNSEQAKALSHLTADVLRPSDPDNPSYRTAADVLRGLKQIQAHLEHPPAI